MKYLTHIDMEGIIGIMSEVVVIITGSDLEYRGTVHYIDGVRFVDLFFESDNGSICPCGLFEINDNDELIQRYIHGPLAILGYIKG